MQCSNSPPKKAPSFEASFQRQKWCAKHWVREGRAHFLGRFLHPLKYSKHIFCWIVCIMQPAVLNWVVVVIGCSSHISWEVIVTTGGRIPFGLPPCAPSPTPPVVCFRARAYFWDATTSRTTACDHLRALVHPGPSGSPASVLTRPSKIPR